MQLCGDASSMDFDGDRFAPLVDAGLVLQSRAGTPRDLEADRQQGRLFRNIAGDSVGYVGKEICRSCHAELYDSYMETGMGRSWGLPGHSKASWNGVSTVVYDKHIDMHYQSIRTVDGIYILEFRLDEKGDTVHRRKEKVDMVVGSGQHTNSHIMVRNGKMCQMPMTYYTQEGRWDLPLVSKTVTIPVSLAL